MGHPAPISNEAWRAMANQHQLLMRACPWPVSALAGLLVCLAAAQLHTPERVSPGPRAAWCRLTLPREMVGKRL